MPVHTRNQYPKYWHLTRGRLPGRRRNTRYTKGSAELAALTRVLSASPSGSLTGTF